MEGELEDINRVVLTGRIAADPQRDKSRDGEAITALLISFPAPDEGTHWGSACCEVEVLDEIADPHRKSLRGGASIMVAGELTGAGGIWARLIAVGEGS
jgi:single-stranded DNA-binding protein